MKKLRNILNNIPIISQYRPKNNAMANETKQEKPKVDKALIEKEKAVKTEQVKNHEKIKK